MSNENNFSENWVNWVRGCPANRIKEIKESLKNIISDINSEPVSEETWNNYFYKRTELPPRFRNAFVEYARTFENDENYTLSFGIIKEKKEEETL